MESFEFNNNIKAEKAEAMRRYNRQKRLKDFLFLLELFTALALLSWSSYNYIPAAAQTASAFLLHYVAVLCRPLYVFAIINVLILVISVLSSQKPTKPDFYEEYVAVTDANSKTNDPGRSVTATADDNSPAPEDTVSNKEIICVDNAVVNNCLVEQNNTVGAVTGNDYKPKNAVQDSTVCAVAETKKFRRTRSERRGRESRRELRRSETTVIKREKMVVARRSCEMDELSSEEFRMTIETFIAAKKKTLIRENTLDLKLARKQCVAITLSSLN